jgi:hypothetical protein
MLQQLKLLRNLIIRHLKEDPKDKSRFRDVVDVKKIFCLLAFYEVKGFRYAKVGSFLGMNHATIVHHVRTAKDLLKYDMHFKEMYRRIEGMFFMANQEVEISDIESEMNILLIKLKRLRQKRNDYLDKKEKQKLLAEFEADDLITTKTLTENKNPLLWTN